jgi:DNA-binding XRE family transcriptional regulator
MKTISERIWEVRISHGRTYRTFADTLGVADTTVMKWERGIDKYE